MLKSRITESKYVTYKLDIFVHFGEYTLNLYCSQHSIQSLYSFGENINTEDIFYYKILANNVKIFLCNMLSNCELDFLFNRGCVPEQNREHIL